MKYDLAFFIKLIQDNNLQTFAEFRKKFPAQHLFYTRHRLRLGDLPLIKTKRANNELTKDTCSEIAKQYQYRSDFQTKDKGAYITALRKNWLDDICTHMIPKPFIATGGRKGKPAHNRLQIEGKKFGKWTVLQKAGLGKNKGWMCRCDCGTVAEIPTSNINHGLSTKCVKCSNQVSRPMLELANYVRGLGLSVNVADKSFGFEIDLFVPDKKFFIEYDGLIWHSSKFRATEANEAARYFKFKQAGISGIRIFEDQYLNKPELVKKMIAHRLGCKSTVKPSEVEYRIVEKPSAYRAFCDNYHIDGYGRSKWAAIAISGDTVLAFMGFRPYMAGQFKGQPELSRFCTNYNFDCYGLFGKMLKLAKQHIKLKGLGTVVVSASDNAISEGKVYANNGFTEHSTSNNWYYYRHSAGHRMHRAIGKRLKPPQITVEEFAKYPTERAQVESGFMSYKKWGKSEPLYKIWGWGQRLWVAKIY